MWQKIQSFRKKYPKQELLLFFLLGFLFDVLTIDRIDDITLLLQQASYLVVLTFFLMGERRFELGLLKIPQSLIRVWAFKQDIIHFLFGSLLSSFTLFYIRSASGLASFLFICVLAILLVVNELPRFRNIGPVVRMGLLSFCYVSFLAYLVPSLIGSVRTWIFIVSIVFAFFPMYFVFRYFVKGSPRYVTTSQSQNF